MTLCSSHKGRVVKIDLSEDELCTGLYNRDNGNRKMNIACDACGIIYSTKAIKELKILATVRNVKRVFCKNCNHIICVYKEEGN